MGYRFNEGSLELPEDWHDETMNIFKSSPSEGYNLVISRDRIPKAVDPQVFLSDQLQLIAENLPMFVERERASIELDGRACTWLEYVWKAPDGMMNQINVLRVVGDMLVSFTLTSSKDFSDSQKALFRDTLESYTGPE